MIRNALALTVLAAAACTAETPLLSLIDPAAQMIGGIRVDRTLSSPLGRYLLSQMNGDDPGFKKFVDMTGFDPRLHVREVVMAAPSPDKKHGIVVARGVFDGPRILSAAQQHGGIASNYGGVPVIASKDGQWLTIIDGAVAAMGEQALVQYAINHRNDTATLTAPLAVKASSLQNQHDGWMVTAGATALPKPPAGNSQLPIGPALSGIVQTSGGIDFGAMVRVTGQAVTRSEKDAQALVDIIRFVAAMARGQNNPDIQKLEPLFNSLDVKAEAATVSLSFAVPEADLEQIIRPKRTATRQAAARRSVR